jgi:hypothetical protein
MGGAPGPFLGGHEDAFDELSPPNVEAFEAAAVLAETPVFGPREGVDREVAAESTRPPLEQTSDGSKGARAVGGRAAQAQDGDAQALDPVRVTTGALVERDARAGRSHSSQGAVTSVDGRELTAQECIELDERRRSEV